ncbi:dihydropteroate synthase [Psychromonas sp. 14N.309.X.WAT.B.A12]|uniref:dihydropteroate synthase n=1 Tax=unclassified Psychromonas TaxID=2614957 RepID=UPI0025B169C0|nr:dihydropteroate synthase [Psychromonas sp. 14N.309.X.WAT.B.A12]MDN2663892.1 dihydropteroate synthase [Psychromonas sp. 14N.309.X.WAT.B.A12]
MILTSRHKHLDLSQPQIMGILNVTPDSFSDGGKFAQVEQAVERAKVMLEQGATIIDIGGESTRPGADDVVLADELGRVIPVIKAIKQQLDCWISIDTSKAEVMREAVKAGANIINDVRALQEEGALAAAVEADVPVCLMHMQGQPRSMQSAPDYKDVVAEVKAFLVERSEQCIDQGIKRENIIIDLGFGFGKSLQHNFDLLNATQGFIDLGFPVLTGVSRKSMFGQLLNRDINDRLAGSLAGAMIAMQQGSKIIRVHDVRETVDVMKVLQQINTFK